MLDKNDLQAISELLDRKFEEKLQPINERLDRIETDIALIREDAAITRNAANRLIEWAEETHDQVGRPVPDFPIRRVAKG